MAKGSGRKLTPSFPRVGPIPKVEVLEVVPRATDVSGGLTEIEGSKSEELKGFDRATEGIKGQAKDLATTETVETVQREVSTVLAVSLREESESVGESNELLTVLDADMTALDERTNSAETAASGVDGVSVGPTYATQQKGIGQAFKEDAALFEGTKDQLKVVSEDREGAARDFQKEMGATRDSIQPLAGG